MSNADRIEELRAKYEENPRRYFAPLANEYRKAGDLAQAIAICREHLPKQPGHMSGFIVYGQTLFEANKLDEARTVFEQALALDPENLIALKHLGDIARMNGENGIARRWYARVLDADPRNDDIASQLASLGAPTPIAPMPAIPEPQAAGDSSGGEAVGVFATFDPGSLLDVPEDVVGIAGSREFWAPSPPEARAVPQHEPLDLDFPESPEPAAEADFEEGLMAPEWPDTSELVARVVTPFHSATPISVPATPDTVAAFGREAYDQVEKTPVEQPPADELVAAFLPPEPVARVEPSDEPVEFLDHEFAADEFETDEAIETAEAFETNAFIVDDEIVGVPAVDDSIIAEGDIITGDFVVASEVAHESTQSFLEELASFESQLDETGDDEQGDEHAGDLAADTPLDATPDEDIVWADSVVPNSDAPEMFSVEEFSAEPVAELNEFATGDTQEFEIPEQLNSGAHPAFAEIDESFTESFAEDTTAATVSEMISASEDATETETVSEAVSETVSEAVPDETDVSAVFEPIPEVAEYVGIDVADDMSEDVTDAVTAQAPVNETIEAEEDVAYAVTAEAAVNDTMEAEIPEESFAEVASQLESEKAPFVTETMAELLVAQGFLPRAIEVYDELVNRRPHDPVLVARLHELRALHEAEEFSPSEPSVVEPVAASGTPQFNTPVGNESIRDTAIRNTPIRNTPLYMTPQYSAPAHATPHYNPALSATPALVPAVDEADTVSNVSERRTNERLQAFRTARERFAELSRRRVARRTPPHATAVPDEAVEGLASLFGTAVPTTTDELAARALADAFGPVQDSGESLFDPAPSPTPAMPMRSLTPRSTTPVYTPATPASKQGSDRQPAADYSFDRFFPDPAMAGREGQSMQASAPVSSSSQPVNEDLAQFSAWLKGLNNA